MFFRKKKVKEAKRFIRESKTAQSANVETQNFLPIPSGSGATMASGSTNNKKGKREYFLEEDGKNQMFYVRLAPYSLFFNKPVYPF